MDIYNTKPRKIKCVRNDDNVWGGGGENHHLLEVGKEYTVEKILEKEVLMHLMLLKVTLFLTNRRKTLLKVKIDIF